jgi:hypothetical protein
MDGISFSQAARARFRTIGRLRATHFDHRRLTTIRREAAKASKVVRLTAGAHSLTRARLAKLRGNRSSPKVSAKIGR